MLLNTFLDCDVDGLKFPSQMTILAQRSLLVVQLDVITQLSSPQGGLMTMNTFYVEDDL